MKKLGELDRAGLALIAPACAREKINLIKPEILKGGVMAEKPLEQIAEEIKKLPRGDLERAFIGQVKISRNKTVTIRDLEDSRCIFCKTPVKIIAA